MTLSMILCEISNRMLTRGALGDVDDSVAIAQAIERIERLSTALTHYGRHLHICEKQMPMPRERGVVYEFPRDFDVWRATRPCTCGLEAELNEATK
jgi:hypothetical protein